MSTIAERIERVRTRLREAQDRRGPGPAVTLVAASKRQGVAQIREALAAGLFHFGESYAQELRDKQRELAEHPPNPPPQWHFVGALQTNKVKWVFGVTLIHTVDRLSLLDALERRGSTQGGVQDVLVQVNLGGERQKAGVDPARLTTLLDGFAACRHVRCRGLMAIPPMGSPEAARGYFMQLRELRDLCRQERRANVDLAELSMGMSEDFEVAIEEGATLVRVGTAIFGPRPP